MVGDAFKVITVDTASLLLDIAEDYKECDDPFACLEEGTE